MNEENKYGENEVETDVQNKEEPIDVESSEIKWGNELDGEKENSKEVNNKEQNWNKEETQDGIYRLNKDEIPKEKEETQNAVFPNYRQGTGQNYGGYQNGSNYQGQPNYQNGQNFQDQNYQNGQNYQGQSNYQGQQNYQNYQGQPNYQNGQGYYQQGYYTGPEYSGSPKKEPKEPLFSKKFWRKLVATGIIAAVLGVTVGIGYQGGNYLIEQNKKKQEEQKERDKLTAGQSQGTLKTTDASSVVTRSASDVSAVVNNVEPSIVAITNISVQKVQTFLGAYDEEVPGSGSGIIIGKNEKELLVATNNHVIENSKEITVTFIDGKSVKAEVKGTDSVADLAVVAIKLTDMEEATLNKIKIAALGDSEQVKVGEMVIAIGNALGYGQSVTVGYISAKDRVITENKMTLLQTDAAINPGNSGGALLNMKGEVIGINSIKFSADAIEGMGYAIPMSKAAPIINDLMEKEIIPEGEQGVLNITGNTVDESVHTNYGVPMGALVATVVPNGAAEKAGILAGDIITKINGVEVETFEALAEKVKSNKAGTKIKLTVQRRNNSAYEEKTFEVTLDKQETTASTDSSVSSQNKEDSQVYGNPYSEYPNGSSGDLEDFFRFFQ